MRRTIITFSILGLLLALIVVPVSAQDDQVAKIAIGERNGKTNSN